MSLYDKANETANYIKSKIKNIPDTAIVLGSGLGMFANEIEKELVLDYKDMQVDHIKPLRVGGNDDISNMLPACRSCNHYKAALDLEQFREYVYQIPKRLKRDSVPFQVGVRFGIIKYSDEPVRFYFEED